MNIKMMIATLTIAVLPGLAAAQTTPSDAAAARIDQRQANQQQRIDQGVKSGELNQREAARLQKGQDRVQRKEDKAKADDVITKKEANQIERTQDRQSARIYDQKHDKQKAPK